VAAVEKMLELLLGLRVGREGGALSDRRQAAASSSSWAKKNPQIKSGPKNATKSLDSNQKAAASSSSWKKTSSDKRWPRSKRRPKKCHKKLVK